MTILMTSDMPGVTQEGYESMARALGPLLARTPGFISHVAGPVPGGFRVTEVWETEAAHREWYATHVAPAVPADAPAHIVTVQEVTGTIARS